ncbi:MAG: hypothetical protein K0S49_2928, partial [Microbacterium sp.]|nr:hypothetical protein [Microbacterium sp.]
MDRPQITRPAALLVGGLIAVATV